MTRGLWHATKFTSEVSGVQASLVLQVPFPNSTLGSTQLEETIEVFIWNVMELGREARGVGVASVEKEIRSVVKSFLRPGARPGTKSSMGGSSRRAPTLLSYPPMAPRIPE